MKIEDVETRIWSAQAGAAHVYTKSGMLGRICCAMMPAPNVRHEFLTLGFKMLSALPTQRSAITLGVYLIIITYCPLPLRTTPEFPRPSMVLCVLLPPQIPRSA
jgi:hypothetical protein